MRELQSLEDEIQRLWNEAQTMLGAANLELVPAEQLVATIRDCSQRAIVFGLIGGESKLRQAADDLEIRIRHERK